MRVLRHDFLVEHECDFGVFARARQSDRRHYHGHLADDEIFDRCALECPRLLSEGNHVAHTGVHLSQIFQYESTDAFVAKRGCNSQCIAYK